MIHDIVRDDREVFAIAAFIYNFEGITFHGFVAGRRLNPRSSTASVCRKSPRGKTQYHASPDQ